MARGSASAQAAATTAQKQGGTNYAQANSLYGPLSTAFATEAAHPPGINPTDLARMDTSVMQTVGGSNASAVGQGALKAARTRNAGGADAAIAEAARTGGETASRGILANRMKNADVQQEQRREGLSGMNSLFAENMTGGNAALGESANNTNADVNAQNASWDWAKDLVVPLATGAMGTKRIGG
jgi:hypothetical protein